MRLSRQWSVGRAVLAALITLVVAVATYVVSRAVEPGFPTLAAAPAPPSVAAAATSAPPSGRPLDQRPAASAAGVAAALDAAWRDARLGGRVVGQVSDGITGQVLLDRDAAVPVPPASTAKLATALAVLSVRAPTDRIVTRVLAGRAPDTVVLVGGGDPTLTAAPAGQDGAYADAGRLADLVAQLRAAGVSARHVVVDGSRFSGPAVSPAWAAGDAPSSYAAPIVATMVDGGRDTPPAATRSADPAAAAGRDLAAALGLPSAAVAAGQAPAGAAVLATVRSAPIGELVRQMLQLSDNVIAECLARQVALAVGQPASFAGAAIAVRTVLESIGVSIGSGLVDGSGLAASDRITPSALVDVVRTSAFGPRAAARELIDDLPVAGWDGTLAGRFTEAPASSADGFVRAKTGTLTGLSALSGVVQDADGRLMVFTFVADRVGPTPADTAAAETALDAAAATLTACGCR